MAVKKSVSRKSAKKKKAAKTRKPRVAAKKKAAEKAQVSPAIADIDNRIAILRNNLRDLTAQATAYSGASTEELMSDRIAEQEAKLAALIKQREQLVRRGA
jgi:hypothetical protein